MKNSQKMFSKVLNDLINLFADMILPLLTWTGAVIALGSLGERGLMWLLFLAGLAWLYKNFKEVYKKPVKKEKKK